MTEPMKTPSIFRKPCPNCQETVWNCACMRNICLKCKEPIGNITFTVCDECWDKNTMPSPSLEKKP